ncbi:hypothetical protein [Streptomyces fradiae]|nr:hypothetical protein [Streptomyces fradiae]
MRTHRWAATALTCLTLSGIAAAPALAAISVRWPWCAARRNA